MTFTNVASSTTQNVNIDSTASNVYTFSNPTNSITASDPVDSCPILSNTIEIISSTTSIQPQFPSSCTQPCTQIDLTATNKITIIKFKIRTKVEGNKTHLSPQITIKIICVASSTSITSSVGAGEEQDYDKDSSTPNTRYYFSKFTCSQDECCQSMTYTISSTNSVSSPSAHSKFSSPAWDSVKN